MTQLSRRQFLTTSALSLAATRLRAQDRKQIHVNLVIPAEATGLHVPDDFIGLSYEVEELANPAFFSAGNSGLIRTFMALSPHGVLRLGGNTGEFGWWKATPDSPEPEHPKTREVVGEPKASYYAVTPEAVRNLAAFLEATGWTCLYGINMGTNTPARAAEEAEFVAKTLGSRLQYFQIGNEVDLFDRHLRDPQTWSAKTYLTEWLALARAVAARVPRASFGIPDVASNMSWLTEIANNWSAVEDPPHVTTLTHHYYFGGPATNPDVNIPNLLKPATVAKVQGMADTATAAAVKMGIRHRMTEGNTCYRGGKPGVSDVFAAALWAADYSLLLASNNYSGINLHGGTGTIIASGLGGFLPGDVMLKDQGATPEQIAVHPHPFYTPIASIGSEYLLQPVAYGLKFAGSLSGATLIQADLSSQLQAAGINATAYAAKLARGQSSVIVLNKDMENDLALRLDFAAAKSAAVEIETLRAPSVESREAHITRAATPGQLNNGKFTVAVPHASALRVTVV
ncbi:MAG: hypothetical protein ABR865_01160 [Terracidiphilus sp.]|jgi:hypothetical protein